MNRLIELASKLTPAQLREIEDFAAFLIARPAPPAPTADAQPKYIDVDAIAGMFAGMGSDKSDKELVREAWDEIAAAYEK
jgi:hypothetical protein